MLKIYFTNNNKEWSADMLQKMLLPLPEDMRKKVLAYKSWRDRQARILSKHLLMRLFGHFKLDLTLADIKYTEFNKPYFDSSPLLGLQVPIEASERGAGGEVHFSTAHSGNMVICAGTMDMEIGIDIEEIAPINIADYQEQLTKNEWSLIQKSPDRLFTFYKIWTRKEALLKALGRGIDIDLNILDVCADRVSYENKYYWFYPLSVADNYIAHMATSAPSDSGSVSSEMLSDLL